MKNGPSRRGFLGGGAGALLSAALPARSQSSAKLAGKPNIVYIHSHDSGRYLGPYGHAMRTPALNKLAKQGVLFRQMHSAAPVCSASRAALLTGQCPHENGMMGLAHLGWKLNDYNKHILHTLRQHGYTSTLAGLQHIAADPEWIGFDEMLPHATNYAADVTPGAVRYLTRQPKQPFFLDVGFQETHRPYPAPVDNADFILPPSPIPDTPETRLDMAAYHACAAALDKGVAAVLNALDDAGLADNTIVISTTDHGIAFPDMKCSLRDAGTGVSFIMRGPGLLRGGKVCDAMLSQIDVFPTLCDLLEIEKPAWLEGRSFMPVLDGRTRQVNDAIYAEMTYHAAYEPKRSVRTERWKYIRHFDDRHAPTLPNCDDSPSKTFWLNHGWKTSENIPKEEFYDLVFDPQERNNLVNTVGEHPSIASHRELLIHWMKRTDDPLLKGPVPLPLGAHVVSPDDVSPASLAQYDLVPPKHS